MNTSLIPNMTIHDGLAFTVILSSYCTKHYAKATANQVEK